MPTVISYDNPALVAHLAANVSGARGGQEGFDNQLKADADNRAFQAQQQQASESAQRLALEASAYSQQQQQAAQARQPMPTPEYTEGGGEQATIYHPAGEQMLGPGQMQVWDAQHAAALGGAPGAGRTGLARAGGGYRGSTREQQAALGQLDDMHDQGQLDDSEYARRKGIVLSGGDAFSEPTAAEKQRELQQSIALKGAGETQYQQQQMAEKQQEREAKENKEAMGAERQALLDQVKVKEARLKDATLDEKTKGQLHQQIEDLGSKLSGLPAKYAGKKNDRGQAPQQQRPIPRSLMPKYIAAAGGDPEKAKQLAIHDGFNPNNIVDDRPDRGIGIQPSPTGLINGLMRGPVPPPIFPPQH